MTAESDVPLDGRGAAGSETLDLVSIRPALTVADMEKSLAWYRDVVGFQVEETFERDGKVGGASLTAGGARVLLVQDNWEKRRDRVKGEGFRLHMATDGDVDAIAAAIEQRGGTLESPPEDTPWGARAFSLADPDGFKITISSHG